MHDQRAANLGTVKNGTSVRWQTVGYRQQPYAEGSPLSRLATLRARYAAMKPHLPPLICHAGKMPVGAHHAV